MRFLETRKDVFIEKRLGSAVSTDGIVYYEQWTTCHGGKAEDVVGQAPQVLLFS